MGTEGRERRARGKGLPGARRWVAVLPALSALLLAACGSDSSSSSGSGSGTTTETTTATGGSTSTGGAETGGSTSTGGTGAGGSTSTGGTGGGGTAGQGGSTTTSMGGGGATGGNNTGGAGSVVDCGNGVKDSGEDCDGADLGGKTCAAFGFVSPAGLACAGCVFDTSGCKDNGAPEITSTPDAAASEGQTWYYAATAKDPEADPIVWSLPVAPVGMTIVPDTGHVEWTPGPSAAGDVAVTVRATDSGGSSADQAFTLTVAGVASPPKITSTPPLSAMAGALYSYPAAAADPDSPMLTWSVTGPAGMAVSAVGLLTWSVPAGASGTFPVTLSASDGTTTTQQVFTIGVSAAGDATPPVVTITAPANDAKITDTINVTGTISDPALAGYDVSLCRVWGPAGNDCRPLMKGLGPVMNGVIASFDPSTLPNGQWDLTVTAKDAAGNTTTKTVSTLVEGTVKRGVIRLSYTDLYLRTETAELRLDRVYDGLDLGKGQLGYGWRYEWKMGHFERPKPLQAGWTFSACGFPPHNCVNPAYNHPARFHMPDGRVYEFSVTAPAVPVISSVHEVIATCTELSATGATLRLLDSGFTAYTQQNYTLWEYQGVIYEDFVYTPWEPVYYELTTDRGEVITYKTSDFQAVKMVDPSGVSIDMTGPTMKVGGKNAVSLTIGADGFVKAATDPATGFTVQYTQDATGDLVGVTTSTGAQQTFDYDPGHKLASYQESGLALESYEYDDRGRLTKHSFPNGAVELVTYDDATRTVTKTDAAGNAVTSVYDTRGRVTSITDPLGRTSSFTYVGTSNLEASRTDPLGHTWSYQYDASGRRTSETDPLGGVTLTSFDKYDEIAQGTDAEGRVFKQLTDAAGRVTALVLPDGQTAKTFSYPTPQTVIATDAEGHVETTVVDLKGRTTSFTNADGETWTIAYDDVAHTRSTTRPDGVTTVATVDALDRVKHLTLGDGSAFTYKWSTGSQLDEVTRPDGLLLEWQKAGSGEVTALSVGGTPVRHFTYDALGRLASESEPGGFKQYEYDAAGQTTSITEPGGQVVIGYDAAGRVTSTQASNGRSVVYAYDAANRLTSLADSAGRTKHFAYDKTGRPTQLTDELGRTTLVAYDANGNPGTITLPDGRTASYTYYPSDAAPTEELHVATAKDPDGIHWSYSYDNSGQIAEVTDALGGISSYEYDAKGHATQIVDALSRVTTTTWGPHGITGVAAPGGATQSWTYGADGSVATWTRADGSVATYGYAGDTTTMSFAGGAVFSITKDDVNGTTAESGAGVDVLVKRDFAERVASVARADGALLEMDYTPEGHVASTKASLPGGQTFSTHYTYDVGGRLVAVQDPAGGTSQYGYDDAGRLTSIQHPNGTSAAYTYGALDRPASIEHFTGAASAGKHDYGYDANGILTSETTPQGTFEYGYDALGRLTQVKELQGGQVVATVTSVYDGVGNLQSRTDAAGTTTYSYGADDRLLSQTGPGGATMYEYSGRGALTKVSGPSGITTYSYDPLDRLTQVTLPGGQAVTYRYDVSGRLLSRLDAAGEQRCLPLPQRPDGNDDCALLYGPGGVGATAQTFGPEGFSGAHSAAGSVFSRVADRGSVVGLTGAGGASVGSRAYDAWGAVTTQSGAAPEHGYLGERQDPATGLVYLRARWYDPSLGRFLTPDRADAASRDPRTLHRYTYASLDPKNKLDRTGEMSLGSCMAGISVQGVLGTISRAVAFCLKKKIEAKLFRNAALFVAKHVISFAFSDFASAVLTGNGATLIKENKLQQWLANYLCFDFPTIGEIEFEVPLKPGGKCGEEAANGKILKCSDAAQSYKGKSGIDIVLARRLPVELKWDSGSKASDAVNQLKQRCRFAHNKHSYVALWIYWDDKGYDHDQNAQDCWDCFDAAANCPGVLPPPFKTGSVYVATGVHKLQNKQHVYVPDPKKLCQ